MMTTDHIIIYLPNQKVFKDGVNSLTRKKKERKKEKVIQVVGNNYSLRFMRFNTKKVIRNENGAKYFVTYSSGGCRSSYRHRANP